jgi:hypothetical protein
MAHLKTTYTTYYLLCVTTRYLKQSAVNNELNIKWKNVEVGLISGTVSAFVGTQKKKSCEVPVRTVGV